MIKPIEFWQRLAESDGPDTILLIHFESWKQIANEVGIDGVDLAMSNFDGLCKFATNGANSQSRLSLTLFGASWVGETIEPPASRVLKKWFPIKVSGPELSFQIKASWAVLHRDIGESGKNLYLRAQTFVRSQEETLLPKYRFPTLNDTWEETANCVEKSLLSKDNRPIERGL